MRRKSKRIIAMILAALMIATAVPAEHLLSVRAAVASPDEIENYVSSQKYFTQEQYDTLKEYYDTCVEQNYDIASMDRLENAVNALEGGADFYDDFQNFGTYKAESEVIGGTTYGVEPANAGDFFPTVQNDTNYEILFGGLKAQRMTENRGGVTNYADTWPSVYSTEGKLNFAPFHFKQYSWDGAGWNQCHLNGESSANAARYVTDIDVKHNWLVLKPELIPEEKEILSYSLTAKWADSPRIVYNYQDAENYNFIGVGNLGIIAFEVKDGHRTHEVPISGTTLNNYPGFLNRNDADFTCTFKFIWNESKGCYTLTVTSGGATVSSVTTDLSKSSFPINKVEQVQFGVQAYVKKSMEDAFQSITVSYDLERVLQNVLDTTVPDVSEVTREMLSELLGIYNEYQAYGEDVLSKLDLTRLNAAIEEARRLQAEYDSDFTLKDTMLTAEDGHSHVWKDYFQTTGYLTIVNNPKKDSVNSSDKVFRLQGRNLILLKESMKGKASFISGRTTANIQLYYAYVDENNYAYIQLGGATGTTTHGYAHVYMKDGARGGSNAADVIFPEGVTQASDWTDFSLMITGTDLVLSYGALGTDGNYYYDTVAHGYTTPFQEAAIIGFSSQNPGETFFDDICVEYAGSDAAYNIENFFKTNEYLLELHPYTTHVSASDSAEYTELITGYEALTADEKNVIGAVNRQKIADIKKAYETARGNASAMLDAGWASDAANDYKLANDSFMKSYRAFTTSSNDDYLSQWEYGHRQWGQASIVVDETLNRNVLRLSSDGTVVLKDKFTPDKAVLQKVTYKIRGVGDTKPLKPENSTIYVTDPKISVYLYYRDADNRSYLAFYENYYMIYKIDKGKETRSVVNYNEDEIPLDIATTFSVTYENKNGVIQIDIVDGKGTEFVYKTNYDRLAQNNLAFGCYGSSRGQHNYAYDYYAEVYDIEAKFSRGDWDEDVTQNELRVSYTGNTYQAPGDVALIRGENLGNLVQTVKLVRVNDTDTNSVGFIDRTAYDYDGVHDGEFTIATRTPAINWSNAVTVKLIHKTEDSVQFIIPEKDANGNAMKQGIYAVQLSGTVNRVLKTKVVYLNVPVIDYTLGSDGEIASPGTTLDIVGENLAPNQNVDSEAKAAYKRIKDRDLEDVKVKLISKANPNTQYDLEITEITSDYHIIVRIPSDIAVAADGTTTDWQLSVYNGYGDGTAWSIPSIVKIGRAIAEIQAEKYPAYINLKERGATGHYSQNVTPILQAAVNELHEKGGGTIYLPEGVYRIEYTIYLPENIRIIGDGKALTNILQAYFMYNYGELITNTGFVVSSNCEISGIGIYSKRANQVITSNGLVENVTLSDIKFYTNYMGWSNNGMGAGSPLVDRNDLYKYKDVYGESAGFICGEFQNLKAVDIYSDHNTNGLAMFVCYSPACGNSRFENVVHKGATTTWQRALFNNSIWTDSVLVGGNATQAHGVYMENVKFGETTGYNREIWVADLAGNPNWKFQLLTDEEKGITEENSVYLKPNNGTNESITTHAWMATSRYQLYVRNGNGEGQTREIVGVDLEKNCFIIDRPFDVPINRNSEFTYRPPRQDIYFVDCEFYEGSCPGGFFGGCADVVYDGNYYNYTHSAYQEAIFGDVNWYISNVNAVWENTPYSLIASFGMAKGTSYLFLEDATNARNAQMGILFRNCDLKNMPMSNSSYGDNRQYDFIIDNNRFDDMEYIMEFGKNGIPDGLTFYRNTGNKLTAYAKNSALNGSNALGYSYVTRLDDDFKEIEVKLYGDANMDGVVNMDDVTYVQYAIAGKVDLSLSAFEAADVYGGSEETGVGDGELTAMDATLIRYYILGTLDRFPGDTTAPKPDEPDQPEQPEEPDNPEIGEGDGSDDDYTPGYH